MGRSGSRMCRRESICCRSAMGTLIPGAISRRPSVLGRKKVVIDSSPGVASDGAFDLGTVTLKLTARIETGQPAPEIAGTGIDGQRLQLSGFQGKTVLLSIVDGPEDDLWSEVVNIRALYDRFGRDERFAMLTVHTAAAAAGGGESDIGGGDAVAADSRGG